MSSQYETGHAKNVANFQKLIEQVSVYAQYNPSIPNLAVEQLKTFYADALTQLNEVEDKRNANKKAIHTRQQAFENLKPLCTRIINHLDILGITEGTLEQAKSINRTIQGRRKKAMTTNDENDQETKVVSTSRQSFTQQTDNFGILLQLLASITAYNPNLEELKLENLKTYHASLVTNTQAVDKTEAELNTKLIERNQILYKEGTGLYSISQKVKKYVKSLYGPNAPEYINISKIKFTSR